MNVLRNFFLNVVFYVFYFKSIFRGEGYVIKIWMPLIINCVQIAAPSRLLSRVPHFSVDRNAPSLIVTARRLDAVHGRVFGLSPLTVVLSCLFVLFRFSCTTDTVDRQRKHITFTVRCSHTCPRVCRRRIIKNKKNEMKKPRAENLINSGKSFDLRANDIRKIS